MLGFQAKRWRLNVFFQGASSIVLRASRIQTYGKLKAAFSTMRFDSILPASLSSGYTPRKKGLEIPYMASTPYVNTISLEDQPLYPGNSLLNKQDLG